VKVKFLFILITLFSMYAAPMGTLRALLSNRGFPDYKGFFMEYHYFNYADIEKYYTDNNSINILFDLGIIHQDTPYLWGGNSWELGIDCSHFAWKAMNEAGLYYSNYLTTEDLKNIKDTNGLVEVKKEDLAPGDLLVYGYYSGNDEWIGHVVILVDSDFKGTTYNGLVLGSQNGEGVSFISYAGFPSYYRVFWMKLRKILRIKSLTRHDFKNL